MAQLEPCVWASILHNVAYSGARTTKMTSFVTYLEHGMGWLDQLGTCYGLNICVPPKLIYWSPIPLCGCIWR